MVNLDTRTALGKTVYDDQPREDDGYEGSSPDLLPSNGCEHPLRHQMLDTGTREVWCFVCHEVVGHEPLLERWQASADAERESEHIADMERESQPFAVGLDMDGTMGWPS